MDLVIDQPHLVDTLRFRLQASRSVSQGDVRLTVPVTALVQAADRDQRLIEKRIHEALAEFVKAPWTFSRIIRQGEAMGFERVTLRASARVPAAENWDLAERARKASREGLALAPPEISYALSPDKVGEVVDALRLGLLREATEQARKMSEATTRRWRVGDIEFGTPGLQTDGSHRSGKGAYRDLEEIGELLADVEPQALLSGERITMIAAVTLKADTGWQWQDRGRGLYVVDDRVGGADRG